ncbi:hypothetical protein CH336_02930 [Mycoplasmopsis bovis]|nr:hypothetical protein CH320_03070 [Mycoplasmopsis bovis]AXJ71797.1 hypothetical protein CH316_03165 [Mycoplasmopsis bovis]AXJ72659.1 hypothetical protein CH335_03215 [Mycoplasmopsis bovis]AXJ73473.1 hypothetical protein CH336_02930 [Mycoplasmopsis bovis]AXJ75050.1 hypothetical protein CH317_02955 [Mycoplasmopsis bovis]
MSRIGNSLDNREIEYFFSVLKTEMFENFEKSVKKMTLKELERRLIVSSSATPIKVKFNCGALEFLNKKSSTLGSRKLSYELY